MSLPFTHTGLPTLAIPYGHNPAGLPLSIQIVAASGQDEFLLKAARMVQNLLRDGS
jgi:aspartyl-tRNA(Asn)/glutamyl-tRNA(Gln) amidotransferase subunit A